MLTRTDRAAVELKNAVGGLPELHPRLRVFIDHRCHCGAVHFRMAVDDTLREGDTVFEAGGVPFVADPALVPELSKLAIDYREDVMRRGFTVTNLEHACGHR